MTEISRLSPAEAFAFPAPRRRHIDAVKVAEDCPVQIWARFRCGGCGAEFTADPRNVPMFTGDFGPFACCRLCWDRRNRLREQLGEQPNLRPLAYPEDYPPGGADV